MQAEEYLCDVEKMPLLVDPALKGDFNIEDLCALCDIARICVEVMVVDAVLPFVNKHG